MRSLVFFILIMLSSVKTYTACDNIIYVNSSAQGLSNGSSWSNAYSDIQTALDEAQACAEIQEIWVAGGTYKPTVDITGDTTTGTQNLVYNIDFDLKIYGGFCGWEGELYERVKHLCPTVLSGDHNADDVYSDNVNSPDFPSINTVDNSYNIMRLKNLSTLSKIDGFTFVGGDADHPSTLSKQIGGAIFNDGRGLNDESRPIILNCIFQYNRSLEGGGAIYNYGLGGDASPAVKFCEFKNNFSTKEGGAVYNLGDGMAMRNNSKFNSCLFDKNVSLLEGGAMYSRGLNTDVSNRSIITQCTFVHNRATAGAGLYLNSPIADPTLEPIIKGTIFYSNTATTSGGVASFEGNNVQIKASYSLFPEATPADTNFNINTNPQFLNPSSNYRLGANSVAIDNGAEAPSPFQGSVLPIDLDGNSRRLGLREDMGAYEFLACPFSNQIYVDPSSQTRVTGEAPNLALTSLNMALEMACNCPETPEIHIAAGTYVPHRLSDMTVAEDKSQHVFSIECPVTIIGHGGATLTGDILHNDYSGSNSDSLRGENCNTILYAQNIDSISIDSLVIRSANEKAILISTIFPSNNLAKIHVMNTDFRDNYGESFHLFNITSNSQNIEFRKCNFFRNAMLESKRSDGCIHIETGGYSKNLIENCEFYDNDLGGLYFKTADSSSTIVDKCVFRENISALGAGIEISAVNGETSYYNISNSVFADNTAESSGAAIYASKTSDTQVKIRSSTFFRNYTDSRAAGAVNFFNINGSATIENCIFWDNTNDRGEFSISGDVDVSYTLLGDEVCPMFSAVRCNEAILYGMDPLFVDGGGTAGPKLNLQEISPAINRGSREEYYFTDSLDIIGNERHVGRIDLGAYEYPNPDCPISITNPLVPLPGISLQAETSIELSDDYNAPDGGILFLDAQSVILQPILTIEKGGIMEIDIGGCNN